MSKQPDAMAELLEKNFSKISNETGISVARLKALADSVQDDTWDRFEKDLISVLLVYCKYADAAISQSQRTHLAKIVLKYDQTYEEKDTTLNPLDEPVEDKKRLPSRTRPERSALIAATKDIMKTDRTIDGVLAGLRKRFDSGEYAPGKKLTRIITRKDATTYRYQLIEAEEKTKTSIPAAPAVTFDVSEANAITKAIIDARLSPELMLAIVKKVSHLTA